MKQNKNKNEDDKIDDIFNLFFNEGEGNGDIIIPILLIVTLLTIIAFVVFYFK